MWPTERYVYVRRYVMRIYVFECVLLSAVNLIVNSKPDNWKAITGSDQLTGFFGYKYRYYCLLYYLEVKFAG